MQVKKVSRRGFLKRSVGTVLALFGIGGGGYVYARDIEPKLLEVTNHPITNPNIPKGFHDFKIIQFSDTHIGFHYDLAQLKKLITKINELKPDIIFFTGDLMDAPNQYNEKEQIIPILQMLDAPFGKFAIYGNHDHGGYGSTIYRTIIERAGFTLLRNSNKSVKLLDGSELYIIGVDDAMLGKPNFEEAVKGIPEDSFKILLSHAPDLANEAAAYPIHLQLSGHSHGGQIQIPFFGPLVTPPYGEIYYEGFYHVGEMPLTVYVNRGIGTTRLPFRFLAKPELSMFTLKAD